MKISTEVLAFYGLATLLVVIVCTILSCTTQPTQPVYRPSNTSTWQYYCPYMYNFSHAMGDCCFKCKATNATAFYATDTSCGCLQITPTSAVVVPQ